MKGAYGNPPTFFAGHSIALGKEIESLILFFNEIILIFKF
jgi:hypothetical protein